MTWNLSWAERELHRIEMEASLAAIEARERIAAEAEAKRAADAAAADAARVEAARRNSWFNHFLDRSIAGGDNCLATFLQRSPSEHLARAPEGWPPGVSAADFETASATEPFDPERDTIANTNLGAALKKAGVEI